jgi:glycine hydroxymethyltransferase
MDQKISSLERFDPEIAKAVQLELERQTNNLVLIASENYISDAVREVQASVMTNKYAEGYPDHRYYSGCEYVDIVERLAVDRCKELFGAEYANVQPHSGTQANMAVYFSVLEPGDTFLGMNLAHGGHLSHGSPVSFSGKMYRVMSYGVDREKEVIDYEQVNRLANEIRPKLIVAGASSYPRIIDFEAFGRIAQSVGAYLMVDMAHIAGLVAAGVHPSPFPHADFVSSSTHKTLRGPRGGFVSAKKRFGKVLNKWVFPGVQGGPLMHVIAAKAVAFKEALSKDFKDYQNQVLSNAETLADELKKDGFRLVSGGTDSHLVLVDLTETGTTGLEAERVLAEIGVSINKNVIPFDTRRPSIASGIRIGTPAVTTRGMKEDEMVLIAKYISQALSHKDDTSLLKRLREGVTDLCQKFPLFQNAPIRAADPAGKNISWI